MANSTNAYHHQTIRHSIHCTREVLLFLDLTPNARPPCILRGKQYCRPHIAATASWSDNRPVRSPSYAHGPPLDTRIANTTPRSVLKGHRHTPATRRSRNAVFHRVKGTFLSLEEYMVGGAWWLRGWKIRVRLRTSLGQIEALSKSHPSPLTLTLTLMSPHFIASYSVQSQTLFLTLTVTLTIYLTPNCKSIPDCHSNPFNNKIIYYSILI